LERLIQAREQFRGHLAELHTYARQSQEELQALRTQVQAESERLQQAGAFQALPRRAGR
jgi:Skp family chaperone for outer membrane proteins